MLRPLYLLFCTLGSLKETYDKYVHRLCLNCLTYAYVSNEITEKIFNSMFVHLFFPKWTCVYVVSKLSLCIKIMTSNSYVSLFIIINRYFYNSYVFMFYYYSSSTCGHLKISSLLAVCFHGYPVSSGHWSAFPCFTYVENVVGKVVLRPFFFCVTSIYF